MNDWAKTQASGGFKGMLDCGARAFDVRPQLSSESLHFHHGLVAIPKDMKAAIEEVIAWSARNNGTDEDLVVLAMTSCDGSGCWNAVRSVFDRLGVIYIDDCKKMAGLTVAHAAAMARAKGGPPVLAHFDCWESHYEPAVTCSGYGDGSSPLRAMNDSLRLETRVNASYHSSQGFYTCYSDSSTKSFPVNRMLEYINNTTRIGPNTTTGYMYTVQTLWEEDAASIAIGELHASDLLEDEVRSGLNAMLTSRLSQGLWDVSRINMVECNNVCDGGTELLAALRKAAAVPP